MSMLIISFSYKIIILFWLIKNIKSHFSVDDITSTKAMNVTMHCSKKDSTISYEKPVSYALVPYSTEGILSQFYETRKTFTISHISKTFVINQDWHNNGVAGVVWEAALALSKYIASGVDMENKHVLELGAGTGLVGMTSLALGANVTFTDLPKALPLLQENVQINFPAEKSNMYSVKRLEWGKDLEKFPKCVYDLILGADIIYMEETFDALLKTFRYFTECNSEGKVTKILLSSKVRYNRVHNFVKKLKSNFSSINKVYEDFNTNLVIYECF